MGVGKKVLVASVWWAGFCSDVAAALPARPASAARLTILTEYSPPSSMLENGQASGDGRIIGSASDKVREAMDRAGVPYTLQLQPWKRAYGGALERPHTCVFSTTRLPEREKLFKWIGPLDSAEWVLLGLASRQYRLRTLEDARKLRIGTYLGDARDAYLRERGFKVDPAQNDLINPQKLLLGRIDLWAASLRRGSAILEQNGWSTRIVPVLSLKQVQVYLACNRSVPDATVTRLNAALAAMRRDGTTRNIDRKYARWQAPHASTR